MNDERDELDDFLNGPLIPTRDSDVIERDALRREAIVIRARERKLAELAHAIVADLRKYEGADWQASQAWIRRYEEACK